MDDKVINYKQSNNNRPKVSTQKPCSTWHQLLLEVSWPARCLPSSAQVRRPEHESWLAATPCRVKAAPSGTPVSTSPIPTGEEENHVGEGVIAPSHTKSKREHWGFSLVFLTQGPSRFTALKIIQICDYLESRQKNKTKKRDSGLGEFVFVSVFFFFFFL